MRIDIYDDNDNWRNWGALVVAWIEGQIPRPTKLGVLRDQLKANSVTATITGSDDRDVNILSYPDDPALPLVLMIPTSAMRVAKMATVAPGPYPLPLFYDIAYGGAARAPLSPQEAQAFALRRIGEYTVNECC